MRRWHRWRRVREHLALAGHWSHEGTHDAYAPKVELLDSLFVSRVPKLERVEFVSRFSTCYETHQGRRIENEASAWPSVKPRERRPHRCISCRSVLARSADRTFLMFEPLRKIHEGAALTP